MTHKVPSYKDTMIWLGGEGVIEREYYQEIKQREEIRAVWDKRNEGRGTARAATQQNDIDRIRK